MVAHVPLQLRAIGKGVAAVRAAVVILTGLVAILDVFLQRGVAFVAPGAVGASVQLGKRIRCSCGGRERETWMIDDASFFFSYTSYEEHVGQSNSSSSSYTFLMLVSSFP